METPFISIPYLILGGGVGGLWTLQRLRKQGLPALLLESNALGNGQTCCAQGIIHSGVKYALNEHISGASQAIANMPNRWQACLEGHGEIDLSATKITSPYHYFLSDKSFGSQIGHFFADKSLRSQTFNLEKKDYPVFFQHPTFKGQLSRIAEYVLDVPSLITALTKNVAQYTCHIQHARFKHIEDNLILEATLSNGKSYLFSAQNYILTAGEGNETLLKGLNHAPKMQRRPLQMVLMKSPQAPEIFIHYIALQTNPIITITSHRCEDGEIVWYLGGQLAEEGVNRSPDDQIKIAQELLTRLFPWFDCTQAQWQTLVINRAEGQQPHNKRPDSVCVYENTLTSTQKIITAWPTKLAFAPLLADKILELIAQDTTTWPCDENTTWPTPPLAQGPWETLFK